MTTTNPIRFTKARTRRSSVEADCIALFAPKNPPFEKMDKIAKLKICKIKDETTCFVCGQLRGANGKGDHLYARKGYFKKTGCYGIDDHKWGALPACSRRGCNSGNSYKEITLTNGIKIDIGMVNLTDKELTLVPKDTIRIVNIVREWKAYLKKRVIVNYFRPTKEQLEFIEKQKEKYNQFVIGLEEEAIRYIHNTSQD